MVQSNINKVSKVKHKLSVYKTSIALKKSFSNTNNISPMNMSKIQCTRSLPSLVPVSRIEELQINMDKNKIDPYRNYYDKKNNILNDKFELPKINEDSSSSSASSPSPNPSSKSRFGSIITTTSSSSSSKSIFKNKKKMRSTLNDYFNNTVRKNKVEYNLTREDIPYLSKTPLPKIMTEIHQKLPLNIRDVVKFESKEDKLRERNYEPEYSPMNSPKRKNRFK